MMKGLIQPTNSAILQYKKAVREAASKASKPKKTGLVNNKTKRKGI